jgi:hypothetical protein
MDKITRTNLTNIHSADKEAQNTAYYALVAATEAPVDWGYEAWDELLANLGSPENRVRSISSQLLANLAARSDPHGRMLDDFDRLLAVTKDERFVTARHCLQSLWKVGTAGKAQQERVVSGLSQRFAECAAEKNGTLIRYDIIQGLRNLYDAVKEESVKQQALKQRALALIESEPDLKYRKKYAGLWR